MRSLDINDYLNGWGVPKDYVLAHMWWNLAAAQGDEEAVKNRDIAAGMMTPAQIAKAQRLAREWLEAHPAHPLGHLDRFGGHYLPTTRLSGEKCNLV
jgi:TPR repeat protein